MCPLDERAGGVEGGKGVGRVVLCAVRMRVERRLFRRRRVVDGCGRVGLWRWVRWARWGGAAMCGAYRASLVGLLL